MRLLTLFKNSFDGIGKKFRELMNKAKPFMQKEIPIAITIVNNLKSFVDSSLSGVLTTIIPGTVDNIIVERAKTLLPVLLVQLKIANDCTGLNDNDAIIKCALKHLKSISPDMRYGKYIEIASYLSQALVDNKLSWSEVLHAVQIAYDEQIDQHKI